jgi:hypothetical protein
MWPLGSVANNGARRLKRIKAIANACGRQLRCQFCNNPLLFFKQQGLCITARFATQTISSPGVVVPPAIIFAALICLPTDDLNALGFSNSNVCTNHPVNAVLTLLPVLPPVSRPAMRTLNLKTGQPFVVENHSLCEYKKCRHIGATIYMREKCCINGGLVG